MNDDTWPERPPISPPVEAQPAEHATLDAPDYVQQTEVLRSGGQVGRIVALLVGLAFLGGIGWAAMAAFSGDREGAATPEAAVRDLAAALSDEDVVAAIEAMAPSEVGTAADLYPRVIELAVREGAIDREDWLTGVDFEVLGLETETTELHPGVALVELTAGVITVSIDAEVADPIFLEDGRTEYSVSIAEMRAELASGLSEASDVARDLAGLPFEVRDPGRIFLMTVERNGTWFVSPMYTAAEFGRQILDLPPADFAASRENAAAGAATAVGVIEGIESMVNGASLETHLDNALNGDPDGTFAPLSVMAPPDEFGVFIDYASSYQALLDRLFEGTDMTFEDFQAEAMAMIEQIDLEGRVRLDIEVVEEPREDGTVVLHLTSGSIAMDASVVDPDSRTVSTMEMEASWDGLCGRAVVVLDGSRPEQVSDCVPTDVLPAGFDDVFVVVGQVDGDWYMSYIETALAYAELFLEAELAG
ncbi:MAG: hypothetical protein AAF480_02610 [Actinomycetota bacterium]